MLESNYTEEREARIHLIRQLGLRIAARNVVAEGHSPDASYNSFTKSKISRKSSSVMASAADQLDRRSGPRSESAITQ